MTTQFLYVSCARCRGSTQLQSSSNGASWVQATTAAFVQKILSALLRPMMHEIWNHKIYQTDLQKNTVSIYFVLFYSTCTQGSRKLYILQYYARLVKQLEEAGLQFQTAAILRACRLKVLFQVDSSLRCKEKPPFNPESIHPF